MSRKKLTTVAASSLHGKGLFAATSIEPGTILGICKTKRCSDPGEHTLWLESGPVDVTCDLRFINHSKLPNVAYYEDRSVVSLRPIDAGEELTHDYGDDWN